MTIFIILFLVLFLILIFQIIRLIYFAIKKKELSKEVKKTCIVFLCNIFAFILVGVTAPENIKNKAKESGIKKKDEKVKEVKKVATLNNSNHPTSDCGDYSNYKRVTTGARKGSTLPP